MEQLEHDIKEMIIEALKLEDIEPSDIETEAPLFVEGLGLDSIDALDLAVAIEKRYGVKIEEDAENLPEIFQSVRPTRRCSRMRAPRHSSFQFSDVVGAG